MTNTYNFWLIFPDKPTTKRYIDEPINFADADFQLNRKENGMGLDASISGGELKFKFTIYREHYLEEILYWFHKDGFEADVKFGFSIPTGEIFSGEIDFYTADTNDFNYFDCSVILDAEKLIFKRRAEVKVDLFSNKTIDGEFIEPLQPIPMLLQSKPVEQISEWSSNALFSDRLFASGTSTDSTVFYAFNPCANIISSGIEDTFTFFELIERFPQGGSPESPSFAIVLAQSSLRNVKVDVTNLNLDFTTDVDGGGDGYVELRLELRWGTDYPTANKAILLSAVKNEHDAYSFNGDLTHTIDFVNKGDNIWLNFTAKVRQSADIGINPIFECFLNVNSMNTKLTSESLSYNSIPYTFRLVDVMKYVIKSISGLDANLPRYNVDGEFYDTVLTNGKLLGGNTNDPFYVSWDDIEKSIKGEHNADSELEIDGRIFAGIEKDFFTGEECGFFDNTQFSGLTKKANPIYSLNELKLKYAKYQSLKENTEPNSGSTIHGETIFTFANKKVENSKESSIEWVRDAILLDVQQRLSTKISDDTATQDDDTIFAIDTIENNSDITFTESAKLNHTFIAPNLSLKSNGEINFLVLGIKENTAFQIQSPDLNAGNYNVISVGASELVLNRISGNIPSSSTNGIRNTKFTYEIKKESIPLINRTNEGFGFVLNLSTPDKYSNLRYSVQRNIRNYWNSFLAAVNLYHSDKELKNTYYKNNGKCETEYNGLHITEKEDWIPTEPIMTPIMYEQVIFANVDFSDYLLLQSQLRTRRGFIRTIDNNKRVLKLYPTKMSYKIKSRELTMSGNEKFERAYMTIVKQNGIITVNDETKLRNLIYKVEEGNKIVLFDFERQKLYNSVVWDKISVNNALAPTLEILKDWLDLLA